MTTATPLLEDIAVDTWVSFLRGYAQPEMAELNGELLMGLYPLEMFVGMDALGTRINMLIADKANAELLDQYLADIGQIQPTVKSGYLTPNLGVRLNQLAVFEGRDGKARAVALKRVEQALNSLQWWPQNTQKILDRTRTADFLQDPATHSIFRRTGKLLQDYGVEVTW